MNNVQVKEKSVLLNIYLAALTNNISEGKNNKEKYTVVLKCYPANSNTKFLWFPTYYIVIKHDI